MNPWSLSRAAGCLLLATFVLGSFVPVAGHAQEAATEAESAPSRGAELVPPDQIPARATSARVTLDSIRARLPAAAEASDARLEALGVAVDHLRQKSDFSRLERLPEFRIAELQSQVRFHQRELAKLESRDVARATRLSADAAELSRLRAQWEATLAKAEEERLSSPLLQEARSLLKQIDETDRQLEEPLAAALAGRERVSRFEARLEMLVRTLDDASRRAKARRLVRDVPPIWAPGALEVTPGRDWTSALTRIRDQVQYSRDYFEARRTALEVLALCAGLSVLLVLWLRRRSEWFRSTDAEAADASRVLKRPFSSLLLVYLAAALLLSEFAPTIVLEALAVATMLVLLRLMPGRLVAGHGYLLVGLAAIFALDRARSLMPYDSIAFRLDQLLVAAGLAAGYALALRLKRRGEVPPRSWLALMAFIAPVALVLSGAAVASSLLGNISLADLLVHGTLTSTYVSAVLFAAVFIIDDFVSMLVRSRAGQHLRMVTLRGNEIAQTTNRVLRTLALVAWGYITLAGFQMSEPVEARVREWLSAAWNFGELSFTLGGIATFVIGVLVAVYASRMVRFLLNEEILSRVAWPPGAKSTTATLAYYGVLFAGLLLALSAAGIETSQFALVVGALGVGIGFGLQNVVNNFVSGLILMFERPIQPGDIIDVDTLQGRVIEIGLRATRVQTWEGAEVIVPNGTMLSGNLINWTLSDTSRRVEIPVGVAYGTSVRRVLDLLMKVAQEQPDAMKDPSPVVLFTGFGESSLDFSVRFWTRDAATAVAARSEAGAAISEALEAAGIEIPFPQRDLHLRSVDAKVAATVLPATTGTPARATGTQETGNVDSLGPPAPGPDDTGGPGR